MHRKLKTSIDEIEFVVFDFETTGLSSQNGDEIIEIGAIKLKNNAILGEFCNLVNPCRPIDPEASAVNNITDDMVKDAPLIIEVLPDFLEFSRGAVMVAHNATFDLGFLRAAIKRTGRKETGNLVIDTLNLARKLFPQVRGGHSLRNLRRNWAIPCDSAHRALADVKVTVELLRMMIEELKSKGIKDLDGLLKYHGRGAKTV